MGIPLVLRLKHNSQHLTTEGINRNIFVRYRHTQLCVPINFRAVSVIGEIEKLLSTKLALHAFPEYECQDLLL